MKKEQYASSISRIRALLILCLLVAISGIATYGYNLYKQSTCTEVNFGSGSFCLGIWDMRFYTTVNYTGSWNASYIVYNTGLKNVSGTFNGTGYTYTNWDFQVFELHQPTARFMATKQDSSNSTLILQAGAVYGNTSLPYGSTETCFSEVYA